MDVNDNTDLGQDVYEKATPEQINAAVKVVRSQIDKAGMTGTGMYKVSIIVRLSKFDQLKKALNDLGVTGMNATTSIRTETGLR